jgi:hypothetical protein
LVNYFFKICTSVLMGGMVTFITTVTLATSVTIDFTVTMFIIFFSYGSTAPRGPRRPHFSSFRNHTQTRNTR